MNDPDPAPQRTPSSPGSPREIHLQNPRGYPESGARRIRPWLASVVAELAPEADGLGIRFVSDREIRRLNADYRHKDRPTDVLTFPGDPGLRGAAGQPPPPQTREENPFSPRFPGESAYLGDVVISVPTARRQAAERGHETERELRILLLHGLLHCLGYDHEADDGTMERVEEALRLRFGIEPAEGETS